MNSDTLGPPPPRSVCIDGPRPCPWLSCRYHLGPPHSANEWGGQERKGVETCALDVADRGPQGLKEIGDELGVCRERVRQIEQTALVNIRHAAKLLGLDDGLLDEALVTLGPNGDRAGRLG